MKPRSWDEWLLAVAVAFYAVAIAAQCCFQFQATIAQENLNKAQRELLDYRASHPRHAN